MFPRANAFEYKYLEPIQQIQAFPGLSSNVQYNYNLRPFNAKVHALHFTLRPQGALNESQTPGEWVKMNSLSDFPLNFYLSRVNIYPWVFSRAVLAALESGISAGSLYFTGNNEAFYFSASGSLSNVNTEMVISGWVESKITVVQGIAKITRVTGFF